MTERLVILQSCYIPWRGFFDLLSRCDTLVILDSAQYAKRHWHNRNRIMTSQGAKWLSIPVVTKGRFTQPINTVEISTDWAQTHWRSLSHAYGQAPFFAQEAQWLKPLYEQAATMTQLSSVNRLFLERLLHRLGLNLRLIDDRELTAEGARTQRLVNICTELGASTYLSGPSARAYLDETLFHARGIQVEWMRYGPYAHYAQNSTVFDPAVSVLDMLFNLGDKTPGEFATLRAN